MSSGRSGVPSFESIRDAPKVLLHDHLDGGLRPATIVELADQTGYEALPATDPAELAAWMTRGADRHDLVLYLETFQHTVGVMQTTHALARVARECAEDLADDGVVYAEVRFAPEQHLEQGLSLDEVVEAVLEGLRLGSEGRSITVGTLLTAMRTAARSLEIAELAVRWRDRGVVGFDIDVPDISRLSVLSVTRNRSSVSRPMGCSAMESAAPECTLLVGQSSRGTRLSRTSAASGPSRGVAPDVSMSSTMRTP